MTNEITYKLRKLMRIYLQNGGQTVKRESCVSRIHVINLNKSETSSTYVLMEGRYLPFF